MADRQRYRLTLTTRGAVAMQGSSPDFAATDRKFRSWIGSYGTLAEAKIVLAERGHDGTYEALKQWPTDQA
ncbi:hypothetical protein ACWFR5_15915 [Streptomyces sp. NPDC055092]